MSDYMVRATAADAQIRAFAATTGELVEKARRIHNSSPVVTAALGRLLTGGVMMGSMLKGEKHLLTIQVKGDGPIGSMTVTADAQGNVKGYVTQPCVLLPANAAGKLDVGGAVGNGYLSVIKDMGLKEPYVGQTELQSGEIAEDLTCYFTVSEQTPSSVGLGVLMAKDNTVKHAGGFLLQLLPSAQEECIRVLEENLGKFSSVTEALEAGNTPEQLLGILLHGLDPCITDHRRVDYVCRCSRERVERTIVSIGRKEIQEMIGEGKEVEVSCHFCNRKYTFSVGELKELLLRSRS